MSKYVDEVIICEVGPRDGLQAEKTIVSTEDKVELINAIVEAGVPVVEVGSFMHPVKMPQMANTDEVFKRIVQKEGVEYRALIPNARGVERAAACGCKKVKLNVSASRAHNLANLNRTPEESVAGFKAAVDAAKDAGIAISGSISMPFGSPWEKEIPLSDVKSITQAYIDTGITEISLSDTAGVAYPSQVYNYCVEMAKEFPQVTWWMHFHNTRGLAIANIVAAMEAGFTRFDSSFAGAGGCLHPLDDVLLEVIGDLRHQNTGGAHGDTGAQRQPASPPPHNLYNAAPIMGLGGVPQLVHHFHHGVDGGVVADGLVAAGNVVVDGARQPDAGDAMGGQIPGALEGAVAADDYHAFNAVLVAVVHGFLHTFLGAEFGAAGGIQDGAASMDGIGYAAQIHGNQFAFNQTIIAPHHAEHFHPLMETGTHDGAHGGVHARGIAAAGQHSNLFHVASLLQLL